MGLQAALVIKVKRITTISEDLKVDTRDMGSIQSDRTSYHFYLLESEMVNKPWICQNVCCQSGQSLSRNSDN